MVCADIKMMVELLLTSFLAVVKTSEDRNIKDRRIILKLQYVLFCNYLLLSVINCREFLSVSRCGVVLVKYHMFSDLMISEDNLNRYVWEHMDTYLKIIFFRWYYRRTMLKCHLMELNPFYGICKYNRHQVAITLRHWSFFMIR